MTPLSPGLPRASRSRSDVVLARAVWLGLGVVIAVEVASAVLPGWSGVVQLARAVLVMLVVARLLVAIRLRPAKRAALTALLVGQTLWAAGAVVIATTTDPDVRSVTLSPAEVLFLGAFVGFAAFVFLDAQVRPSASLALWLEAGVLAGAAACVALVAMLLPAAGRIDSAGLPLLLALLYPLSDLLLVLALVAQVGLRQRNADRRAFLLIVGFTVLAAADTAFAGTLADGRYSFTLAMNLAWAVSPVIVAQAACLPSRPVARTPAKRFGPWALLVSAAIAVMVLALYYPPELEVYATLMGLLTLLAVGGRVIMAFRDAQRTSEAYRSSLRDELTGLPNRRGIEAAIARLPPDSPRAVLLIGIDSFRDVNESLGHATGDNVLRLFGIRLREVVPTRAPIGRLEGDVFAVVVASNDAGGLLRTTSEIREALGAPFRLEGLEIVLSVAVGVAVAAPTEVSADVLRRALVAMSQAKRSASGVATYDAVRDELSRHHLRDAEALRYALTHDQLEVWYQPQVDASSRRVVGLEALLRWRVPGGEVRAPHDFLPTARRAGLMPALTELVLDKVVIDAKRWHGTSHVWHIAVNVAPPELLSGFVVPQLTSLLRVSGLPAGALVVEVTEDSLLTDPVRAKHLLQVLQTAGIDVSVDDFGTGFSSLAYLRDLHAQELKIDKSFVTSLMVDDTGRMIVDATTRMAHGLGLRVVAEGVEDQSTASALVDLGVDVLQGFVIGRPMPVADLEQWLAGYPHA